MKGEEIVVLLLAFAVGFAISQMMRSNLIESETDDIKYFNTGNKNDPCSNNSRLNEFLNNLNKMQDRQGQALNDLTTIAAQHPDVRKDLQDEYQHYSDFCRNHGPDCEFSPDKNIGCYNPKYQPNVRKVNFV